MASIVKDRMEKIDHDNLTGTIESPEKVELKEVLDPNIQEVALNDVPDNAYLTDKIESPEKVKLKEVLDQNIQEVASNDADNVSISYRKNICKFRDVQRGPVKNCPDGHVFQGKLKLQVCTAVYS